MKKLLLALLVFTFLIRLLVLAADAPVTWDSAAYLANSKYFAGGEVYFEDLRPPLLPVLLIPFLSFHLLVPILLAVLSVLAVFFLVREISNEKIGVLASALVAFNGLFFYWSSVVSVESGEIFFIAAALYFFVKARKENKYVVAALAMSALAFLFRYSLGVVAVFGIAYYLFKNKKINWGLLFTGVVLALVIVAPWLYFNQENYGDSLHSITEGWNTYSGDAPNFQPVTYYVERLWQLANPITLLFAIVALTGLGKFKKEEWLLLAWLAFHLIILHFQGVKEIRYLIPVLPVIAFFASRALLKLKKKWRVLVIVIILVTNLLAIGYISFLTVSQECSDVYTPYLGTRDASLYIKTHSPKDSKVYSNDWPVVAYYSERGVTPLWVGVKREWFKPNALQNDFVLYVKTDYNMSIDKGFLDGADYLEYVDSFGPWCNTVWLYKVKK